MHIIGRNANRHNFLRANAGCRRKFFPRLRLARLRETLHPLIIARSSAKIRFPIFPSRDQVGAEVGVAVGAGVGAEGGEGGSSMTTMEQGCFMAGLVMVLRIFLSWEMRRISAFWASAI